MPVLPLHTVQESLPVSVTVPTSMEEKRTAARLTVEDWTAVDCVSTAIQPVVTLVSPGQLKRCGRPFTEVATDAVQRILDPASLEILCSITLLLLVQIT